MLVQIILRSDIKDANEDLVLELTQALRKFQRLPLQLDPQAESPVPRNYRFGLAQLLCKSIIYKKCSFRQLIADSDYNSLALDKVVVELLLEHVTIINDMRTIDAILDFICEGLLHSFSRANICDQ